MARSKGKNEEILGNLDPKHWVQKSDPLVLMRSVPFSLGELKILDTYISRINAADDTRRTVIFTKEEYEELMGLTAANYRALAKHAEGLLGKVVTLEMPDKAFLKFVLFTKAYYHKDEYGKPIIEITCTEEARDLFFCIGKYHYFSYALENVIKLTRKASYLLYLYIRHNRYQGKWDISLDELRDNVLDCKGQESYQEYKIFKNRVLDPAVKEINEKTDCQFSYETTKRGRRVAKIRFIYHSEIREELERFSPKQLSLDVEDLHTDHIDFLSDAFDGEFSREEVEVLFSIVSTMNLPKTHDMGVEFDRYHYFAEKYAILNLESKKTNIRNRFNYLKKMITNDKEKGG